MKLGGRERMDDGAALEELFAKLPVSADWTIGLLTAVSSGPDAVSPTVWIPAIVTEGAFDETPAARAKVDLLARLFGAVAETLRTAPEIIPPEPEKPLQEAIDFCLGYLRGAELHGTWRADESATRMLLPLQTLARGGGDAQVAERAGLGSAVAQLKLYWQSKRQVVHATPKVGRNDPCPCGSGKKHKKCCLAKPTNGPTG